jgi:hypothetical protein
MPVELQLLRLDRFKSTGGALQSAFVMTVFGAALQVTVTDLQMNPSSG